MKFTICCASDSIPVINGANITNVRREFGRTWYGEIELESLDDLINLRRKSQHDIVITKSGLLEIDDEYKGHV